jgi:hypothetical protein
MTRVGHIEKMKRGGGPSLLMKNKHIFFDETIHFPEETTF